MYFGEDFYVNCVFYNFTNTIQRYLHEGPVYKALTRALLP